MIIPRAISARQAQRRVGPPNPRMRPIVTQGPGLRPVTPSFPPLLPLNPTVRLSGFGLVPVANISQGTVIQDPLIPLNPSVTIAQILSCPDGGMRINGVCQPGSVGPVGPSLTIFPIINSSTPSTPTAPVGGLVIGPTANPIVQAAQAAAQAAAQQSPTIVVTPTSGIIPPPTAATQAAAAAATATPDNPFLDLLNGTPLLGVPNWVWGVGLIVLLMVKHK